MRPSALRGRTRGAPLRALLSALVGCVLLAATSGGADEERPHDPALPRLVWEERVGDFVLRQYHLGCQSQLSYLLGCGGKAVVVDPQRDVDRYLGDAEALGLAVTHVVLTRTHARFVAGHVELAERVGAKVVVPANAGASFEHEAVADGDTLSLGTATLEFWETPGPTADAITVLVHVEGTSLRPLHALTGDLLLVGDVGRPELLGKDETSSSLAARSFDSLQRLRLLPGATRVLPGHGEPPETDSPGAAAIASSIDHENRTNPYLKLGGLGAFVGRVLADAPDLQGAEHGCARANRRGPALVDWRASAPPTTSPNDVATAVAGGAVVVDVRSAREYAKAHVSGALNLGLDGKLEVWARNVLDPNSAIHLVGSDDEVRAATRRLHRVGLGVEGRLTGGVEAWSSAGLPVRTSDLVEPRDLERRVQAWIGPILVDVRSPAEFAKRRLANSLSVPFRAETLPLAHLDSNDKLLFVCSTGYRSSLAVGLAERQGFGRVGNLAGGIRAWRKAGLETVDTTSAPSQAATPMAAPTAR